MPRRARVAPGGWIYHVMNRANGLGSIFDSAACYRDFLRLVDECSERDDMRILAFCAMPNHWHMLLWPRNDGDLWRFVHRLSLRHTKRWHARNGTGGRGHLYQARYKSFLVQDDAHLLTVCRYVERNPLRAGLVRSAFDWPWSSAGTRVGAATGAEHLLVRLASLPIELPPDWTDQLGALEADSTLTRIRRSVSEGRPFGSAMWEARVADRFDIPLERSKGGRPRKDSGPRESPQLASRNGPRELP